MVRARTDEDDCLARADRLDCYFLPAETAASEDDTIACLNLLQVFFEEGVCYLVIETEAVTK